MKEITKLLEHGLNVHENHLKFIILLDPISFKSVNLFRMNRLVWKENKYLKGLLKIGLNSRSSSIRNWIHTRPPIFVAVVGWKLINF